MRLSPPPPHRSSSFNFFPLAHSALKVPGVLCHGLRLHLHKLPSNHSPETGGLPLLPRGAEQLTALGAAVRAGCSTMCCNERTAIPAPIGWTIPNSTSLAHFARINAQSSHQFAGESVPYRHLHFHHAFPLPACHDNRKHRQISDFCPFSGDYRTPIYLQISADIYTQMYRTASFVPTLCAQRDSHLSHVPRRAQVCVSLCVTCP